jgi:hypothetical protein
MVIGLGIAILRGEAAFAQEVSADLSETPTHWAFRPLSRPTIPRMPSTAGARTPIDDFIGQALNRKQLTIGPEADRVTLIRRVCFDLTGLPPTLPAINSFQSDHAPDAYEKMVDRYLASPAYGERWGKYWLDVAGYADSNGYFNADSDRSLAWKYRDYVIRSFNADKPYDRFVLEQLAGDEICGFNPEGDVTAAMIEPLTATHFLRNAPDGTGESDGNPDEVRVDRYSVLEGSLQITMNSLLGITIQCARCHSHKFEPISRDEYYSLQAIFVPAYNPDRWTKPNERKIVIATRAQRDEFRTRNDRVNRQVKALQDGLAAVFASLKEQLTEERLHDLDPKLRKAVMQAVGMPKDKRSKDQQVLIEKYTDPLKIGEDEVAKRFPEYAGLRDQARKALAAREKDRPTPLPELAVLADTDTNPPAHHVLIRGQYNSLGHGVQPGVPAALCMPANSYRVQFAPPWWRVGGAPHSSGASHCLRPLDHRAGQPTFRPCHGQPHLAASLRRGSGRDPRQPRPVWRETQSPGAPRLAGRGVQSERILRQAPSSSHPPIGSVSPDQRAPARWRGP